MPLNIRDFKLESTHQYKHFNKENRSSFIS